MDDPAIAALSDVARSAAARAWQWRASSEKTASAVFADIARGLASDGAATEVLELAESAVGEELGHASLAHRVACRYAGETLPAPEARPVDSPRFGAADARTNRLLFMVLHCCINETIASAYLRQCLKEAEGPVARNAVRALLADEINHARLGWAHLASTHVGVADRAHVRGALPVLLRLARGAWLAPIPGTAGLERGHGCLLERSLRDTVEEAIEGVVRPGFRHLDLEPG